MRVRVSPSAHMIGILHNFIPNSIFLNLGPIQIAWYGFFLSLAMVIGILISIKIGVLFGYKKEKLIDLAFYLIVFGVLGARIYDVFLELPFYLKNPWQIIQIWKGGLAIHGGVIAGVITIYIFSKKELMSFWKTAMICLPGLSIAQAIGRFGNYFNQELFGLPTSLPWGIPIELINRPLEFIQDNYFHPTFLYESIGLIFIFIILLRLIKRKQWGIGDNVKVDSLIVSFYMLLYSILRFSLEFIRVDYSPVILGLRVPQLISIIMALIAVFIFVKNYERPEKKII